METLKLIIEIGLVILLILNVTKEIFWGKKHKDYLESTSAKEVLPNLKAQKKIIKMISTEKIKLQEKYEQALKEIEYLKEEYQIITSFTVDGKEFKAGTGTPKFRELNFSPAMKKLNDYQQAIAASMAITEKVLSKIVEKKEFQRMLHQAEVEKKKRDKYFN